VFKLNFERSNRLSMRVLIDSVSGAADIMANGVLTARLGQIPDERMTGSTTR
jgi:hypothetical protein